MDSVELKFNIPRDENAPFKVKNAQTMAIDNKNFVLKCVTDARLKNRKKTDKNELEKLHKGLKDVQDKLEGLLEENPSDPDSLSVLSVLRGLSALEQSMERCTLPLQNFSNLSTISTSERLTANEEHFQDQRPQSDHSLDKLNLKQKQKDPDTKVRTCSIPKIIQKTKDETSISKVTPDERHVLTGNLKLTTDFACERTAKEISSFSEMTNLGKMSHDNPKVPKPIKIADSEDKITMKPKAVKLRQRKSHPTHSNQVSHKSEIYNRPVNAEQNAVTEPTFDNKGDHTPSATQKRYKLDRLAKFKKPTTLSIDNCKVDADQQLNFDPPRVATVCVLESFSDYMRLNHYDGNPEIDFDKWIRSFNDLMEAEHKSLSNSQKIAQLKCYLIGPARDKIDTILQNFTDFDEIAKELKKAFEDTSFRSLASAKLSLMEIKMAHEDLNSFVERFEKLAKQATAGLSDAVKAQKLLDEFLLKLDPELAFLVRQKEPGTYSEALTIARKNEVLLKLKNIDAPRAGIAPIQTSLNSRNLNVEELARQIAENLKTNDDDSEAYFENENGDGNQDEDQFGYYDDQCDDPDYDNSDMPYDNRVCYYCGKQGHVVRYCYQRKMQEDEDQRQQVFNDNYQVNAVNIRLTQEEILRQKLQNESLKRQNTNLALFGKPL